MRNYLIYGICIVIFFLIQSPTIAFEKQAFLATDIDTPKVVPDKKDLYRGGDFYFGGQPDEALLHWLASEGVKLVINLRTDGEMAILQANFNEIEVAKAAGMDYASIPMGGNLGFTPAMVDSLAKTLLTKNGKVFIHCAVGGRVTLLWMAYLVKYRRVALDDAVALGKRMKFTFPLEDLLGTKVFMTIDKSIR
jgi:uncharacterized protein (TIGR01244 family)